MDRAAPSLSRRNILIGLAGIAVAGVVATARLFPSAEQRTRRLLASNSVTRRFLSLADAEIDEWAAQVGSTFTIDGPAEPAGEAAGHRQGGYRAGGYRMRLAGVRPLMSEGVRPANVTRDRAFLAVFEVLGAAAMPTDLIYTVSHGQYGTMPLFLTASATPMRMHAVFN